MKHQSILLALHRLTASVPLPVAELLALSLAGALAFTLLPSLTSLKRLRRWLRSLVAVVLALIAALALLWGPACAVPADALPPPDAARLSRLCDSLIDALSAARPAFPEPAGILARAPSVAGMAGCSVKASLWPEWMRAAHIYGLFVPLTGEALVDDAAPGPLLPFTAVHELMHLAGVADEGAANIAAWQRCLQAGGAFAHSARLWALRYAMGLLRRQDPAAWQAARQKMEGALLRTFLDCGGEAEPAPHRLFPAGNDYAALAGYLASGNEE